MKSENYHSSKTISYGKELLQKRCADGSIDERELQLIEAFLEERIATQSRFGGAKYVEYVSGITHIRRAGYLTTPWYQLTHQDLIRMVSDYKNLPIRKFSRDGVMRELKHGYAVNTLNTDLRALVTWMFWLSENGHIDITEEQIKKIKIPKYQPKRINRESVYSEEDIAKLVEIGTPMEKCIVWMHYETGARPNEICDLRWSDIEWRNKSAQVRIRDSKEDQIRYAFTALSLPHLIAWRNMYPGKPEGENFVFLNNYQEPLKYAVYTKILKNLQFTHRDGIRIRRMPAFTPHDLRRWRVTNLYIQGASRSTVCKQMWGSTKTTYDSGYSQFSTEDMYSEIEVLYGIREKTAKQKPLDMIYCPACLSLCSPGIRYCPQCGKALADDAVSELETIKAEIKKSPEFLRELHKLLTM